MSARARARRAPSRGASRPAVSRAGLALVALAVGAAHAPMLARAQTPPPARYTHQFGLDAQHTGRSELAGPRRTPRIVWRVRARGRVFASPALDAQGRVVFAGIDGVVRALDAQGLERFAWVAPGPVFATPAVVGAQVLAAHDGGGLAFLDARGVAHAHQRTSDDADAPPAVGPDGTVYLAAGALYALSPEGEVRWTQTAVGHAFGAPALSPDGAVVYLADLRGDLLALRASDGSVLRRTPVGSAVYGAPLVLADGAVVLGTSEGAVRSFAPDGSPRWSTPTRGEVRATPALGRDGALWVGSDDGGIYQLDAATGAVRLRVATSGRVRASARVDRDGYVYVGSEDDTLYALTREGAVAWRFAVGSDIDGAVTLVPWGGLVVGADDGALYYLRDDAAAEDASSRVLN